MPLSNLDKTTQNIDKNKNKGSKPRTTKLDRLLRKFNFENIEELESFLEMSETLLSLKDTLKDALYNAINTIRNKPEVKAKDKSKKYYRDYKRYTKAIDILEGL